MLLNEKQIIGGVKRDAEIDVRLFDKWLLNFRNALCQELLYELAIKFKDAEMFFMIWHDICDF